MVKSYISSLWKEPEINPKNNKSKTLPLLRFTNKYVRCFHLSWMGFFVAFLSWFAFPPLQASITKDLKLTAKDVSNSNIIGLCSTMITRFLLGPLCDMFGPRYVMAGTLLAGALPTALVPLVKSRNGLFVIRFFVGLLGGTFVPCQMWTMTFFDSSIVGRANALAGGWGNSGGGVAFFTMPAIVNDLLERGFSPSRAWKYAFLVGPFIIIVVIAILTLLFGVDCPEGRWKDRAAAAKLRDVNSSEGGMMSVVSESPKATFGIEQQEKENEMQPSAQLKRNQVVDIVDVAPGDIVELQGYIEKPSVLDIIKVSVQPRTLLVALPYATSFGCELAVEAILSGLYLAQSKKNGQQWSQQLAGNWGCMMGLMNIVTRPAGGYISDLLYHRYQTIQVKKIWILICGILQGIFLIWIGLYRNISIAGLIVGISFMAVFMEFANGANFSLVPHISPHHTGIVSGMTGSMGNLGGIMFGLAFRFEVSHGVTEYQSAIWRIGIAVLCVNIACAFIPLKSKGLFTKYV